MSAMRSGNHFTFILFDFPSFVATLDTEKQRETRRKTSWETNWETRETRPREDGHTIQRREKKEDKLGDKLGDTGNKASGRRTHIQQREIRKETSTPSNKGNQEQIWHSSRSTRETKLSTASGDGQRLKLWALLMERMDYSLHHLTCFSFLEPEASSPSFFMLFLFLHRSGVQVHAFLLQMF